MSPPPAPPPCTAPLPLTTPVSNSYKREPKLQQSAASVGSAIPPTSAERARGALELEAGSTSGCTMLGTSCCLQKPPHPQSVALGRGQEKTGDASHTWGTVQLFLCLAAGSGLHFCPLAKEGETDMTCRAAPEEVRTKLETLVGAQSQAISLQLGTARALGPCHALNAEALCIPWYCASLASQCLLEMPNRHSQLVRVVRWAPSSQTSVQAVVKKEAVFKAGGG